MTTATARAGIGSCAAAANDKRSMLNASAGWKLIACMQSLKTVSGLHTTSWCIAEDDRIHIIILNSVDDDRNSDTSDIL